MNEKFIMLVEKYFSGEISEREKSELNMMIEENPVLKNEFSEQKKIKEVLNNMKLKTPSNEFWDDYWTGLYNKFERRLAWIVISLGALIILGYSSFKIVENFMTDKTTPLVLKYGIALLIFGFLILLFSLIREKLFVSNNDKYKEIKR